MGTTSKVSFSDLTPVDYTADSYPGDDGQMNYQINKRHKSVLEKAESSVPKRWKDAARIESRKQRRRSKRPYLTLQ